MSETVPPEDREYLLRNGWYGVLDTNNQPTGEWQNVSVPRVWDTRGALELQRWKDRNSYRDELHETRAELNRYRACLGHHRSQKARLWSEKRWAEAEVKRLKTAITAALDSAEGDSVHINPATDEYRPFWQTLTGAMETQ